MTVGRICLIGLGVTYTLVAFLFWFGGALSNLSSLQAALLSFTLGIWAAISSYAASEADSLERVDYYAAALPAMAMALIGFGILLLFTLGSIENDPDPSVAGFFMLGFAAWAFCAAFYNKDKR